MEITYLGQSAFKIRGKTATILTDPFDPEFVGIKFPKIPADIVTVSHDHRDHNYISGVLENPVVITGSGEYEIKGVRIIGVAAYHDNSKGSERGNNTIYRFEIDGVSFVHCGDLGHKLDDNELEQLAQIDILMIPTGGTYTISAKEAAEVVSQLEPRIIIPMHYQTSSLIKNIADALSPVDVFLKEMGKERIQPQPKLTVSKEKLPTESIVVVLE